jgi:hypothetical protein
MTTFTIQDLTPAQQEAVKQHEAMLSAYSILNTRSINNLPTTPEEDEAMKELFEKMGQDLTGRVPDLGVNAFETPAFSITPQHAPVPQPSQMGEVLPNPDLSTIINTICTQLQLLATVISQSKAQPETTPPEGDPPSLQECVTTTLQQGNWVKHMIEEKVQELIDDKDFAYDVESAVENYFSNSFSLDDHVDISAEVESKVEDIAEGLLKDIVQEQLEEVVAEKLESASVSISF